jgi:hypothetical protein
MKVEILVVSFTEDVPWLHHCLASIKKFASGFSGTTLLVPVQEMDTFYPIMSRYGVRLKTYARVGDKRLWHLDHQRMKCHTDEVCPDADVVFHIDSDTYFNDHITPEDTCPGGKPMLVIGTYQKIAEAGHQMPWKPVVDFCMGGDNKYETIRLPHPCYWRGTYKDVREHISKLHNQDFDKFVLSQKADFPWGFTENNMIGTMCLTPKWRDRYHVVDVDTDGWPKIKVAHFWSHSAVDQPQCCEGKNVDPQFIRPDRTVIPQEVYTHLGI